MSKSLIKSFSHNADSLELLLLDGCAPDERLDDITRQAAKLFKVPIAMINLVTSDRIMFKSCVGQLQGDHLNRSGSFCSYAVNQEEPLEVYDARLNETFQQFTLVTGPLQIRSYLGKSLHAPDGSRIGTLCLLDIKPRKYSVKQLAALSALAADADAQLLQILGFPSSLKLAPIAS